MSQASRETHLLVPRDEAKAKLTERMQLAADIKADDIKTNEELEEAQNVKSDGVSTKLPCWLNRKRGSNRK